jgi:hypothetical protein
VTGLAALGTLRQRHNSTGKKSHVWMDKWHAVYMPTFNGSAAMAVLPQMALLFVWLGAGKAAKQQG